jgi:hypothetical protein
MCGRCAGGIGIEDHALLCAQAVSNALYGLQKMSGDVREVQDALAALQPKIEGSLTSRR